jgi:hypothetical protein
MEGHSSRTEQTEDRIMELDGGEMRENDGGVEQEKLKN